MVVDFSRINYKEKPVLVLKNLDGTAIQTLGYAFNISIELLYNEVSVLNFEIPATVNEVSVPHYSDVCGMRIIDLVGMGQFMLIDPSEENNGIRKVKSCTAYSLEYEFAKKEISLENGTYNFWNPITPKDTIVSRILEKFPDWSIGTIDSDLIGKYRTFDIINDKVYNFIKSNVQETYGCIFEFDTYNRTINIVSSKSEVIKKQIYLSDERLIKKIIIEEDSESIVTCLDVNGAEGVSIRSVNPTGTNKIYNLNYFLNASNFSDSLIKKWRAWENSCTINQQLYYDNTMDYNLENARMLAEQANLTDLKGDLTSLENLQATIVQAISQKLKEQSELNKINKKIREKKAEISSKEKSIKAIKARIDKILKKLSDTNASLSMVKHFTEEELLILQKYFIEDSLQDDSFVTSAIGTYDNDDINSVIKGLQLDISDSKIKIISTIESKTMYAIDGGKLSISTLDAKIVKSNAEFNTDKTFVLTAYLNKGTVGESKFNSGSISLIGKYEDISDDDTSMSFKITDGTLYFTKNTTAYEQHAVEWDLYEYGKQILIEKSEPTYTFSVESGNFLSIDEFVSFKNELTLGKRIYLKIDDNVPITPYVTSVRLDFEDASSFSLEFSNSYTTSDKSFKLAKLLEQSISMGKTLNVKNGIYSEFVNSGASTSVKDFMNSALDIAKNTVLSTGNQAIEFGDSGIRVRKWADDNHESYSDEQIWIVDNMMAFTTDNWETSKMAIGKIYDENIINSSGGKGGTTYGIAAPYIVGTLLAGENLMIGTTNGSFKVDESGVYVDSLKFTIQHPKTQDDNITTIIDRPLKDLLSTNGYLNTNSMEGAIQAAVNKMVSGAGNVLFDGDGIWLMNSTLKTDCTKTVWMNSNGLLFGTGGKCENPAKLDSGWKWTTAIGHDGITTEALASKVIKSAEIYAAKYFDLSGKSMMSNGDYKFDADYLSLYGLKIIQKGTANVSFTIDNDGNVTLGKGSTIKWDEIDETGSSAYKTATTAKDNITNLANGDYSGGTFISGKKIYSPTIYSNEFVVKPASQDTGGQGGFSLYGNFGDKEYHMFKLSYFAGDGPYIIFNSPNMALAQWKFPNTNFYNNCTFEYGGSVKFRGSVNFSGASITGLKATFG